MQLLSLHSPNLFLYLTSNFFYDLASGLFFLKDLTIDHAERTYATSHEFEQAMADEDRRCPYLKERLRKDEKIELFALRCQGLFGNCRSKRPSILNFKARAQRNAWRKLKDIDTDIAQLRYIALVDDLTTSYKSERLTLS